MISMMSIIIKATMEEKLSFILTEPAISKSHHKLSITKCLTLCDVGYPFASDEARQECLFKLYEKMTAKK